MIAEIVLPVPLRKTFDYRIPESYPEKEILQHIGKRVRVPFGYRTLVGVLWKIKEKSEFPVNRLKPFLGFIDEDAIMTESMRDLAEWMSQTTLSSLGDAVFSLMPSEKSTTPDSHYDYSELQNLTQAPMLGDDKDQLILEKLRKSLFTHSPRPAFIQSPRFMERLKIYNSLISEVLSQHKSAVLLVPEITQASMIAKLLSSQWGDDHVVLWSGDTKKYKKDALWWKVKRGEVPIVVGARTAALAPMENLGLIILDDEFSGAYKEERRPRYHARDVLVKKTQQYQSFLVAGGSVPSLSVHYLIQKGRWDLHELSSAPSAMQKTEFELVDMRKEGKKGFISPLLQNEISNRLKIGQKTILFLNRKGGESYRRCKKCGWWEHASESNLSLTKCPQCKEGKISSSGMGTVKLKEEIVKKFPWARVERMDSTSREVPDNFDILVGTELVTQGLPVPRVGLIGLVDADLSLRQTDYRASEITFQLLMRLCGLLEENVVEPKMVIQTRNPEHETFACLMKKDVTSFLDSELRFREDLNYPPYTNLVYVRSDEKMEKGRLEALTQFIAWCDSLNQAENLAITGPIDIAIPRKKMKIQQLQLKIQPQIFGDFLHKLNEFLCLKKTNLWFDVNPAN